MLKKNDMIERLRGKGYTKKDANIVIDDVFAMITEALAKGDSVMIHGFGTFEVRECAPRETVDYQSHERITIPAYKAPKFTAGNSLKRAIKEGFVRE